MRGRELAGSLERLWTAHRKWILVASCLLLALIAAQRLTSGFHELVLNPKEAGDLRLRYREVHLWFQGDSVDWRWTAVYPPASMALLWPFVGWESVALARWLWALISLTAAAWLGWFAAKQIGARGAWEKLAVALVPAATYTVRAAMVNGQLGLPLLPLLLGGAVLLERSPASWKRDAAVAGLFLLALVKPTIAVPFLLILLVSRRPVRPAVLLSTGYAALTVLACRFQPEPLITLMLQWYRRAHGVVVNKAGETTHINIHSWLDSLGLENLVLPASLLILALLAVLLWAFRRSDVWLRLGLAAIVARVWSTHHRYDDVLLLIPLIALIRIVSRWRAGAGRETGALVMAVLLWLSLMVPARFFFQGATVRAVTDSALTVIWLAAFAYLAYRARRDHLAVLGVGPQQLPNYQ